MIRKIALLVCLLIIVGCSTTPNLSQVEALQPGMTRQEMIEQWGKPWSINFINGGYVLGYSVYYPQLMGSPTYHFYFDKNDKLIEWKKGIHP